MTVVPRIAESVRARRTSPLIGWGLLTGGILFFVGGGMHPKEDPPGVSLKEHVRIMFDDPIWYPAHAIILAGMVLIAAALIALARGRALGDVRRVQTATVFAAVASALAAADMLVHMVAETEAHELDAGQATPLIDLNFVLESITVPAFGLSIAVLAVIGAATRTIGHWAVAVFGVVGGLGFALAGGTFLFTDRLGFLFPLAGGIGLWTIAAGIGLLRSRVTGSATGAV